MSQSLLVNELGPGKTLVQQRTLCGRSVFVLVTHEQRRLENGQDQCRLCLVNALMSTERLCKLVQQHSATRRTSSKEPLRPQRSSDLQVSSV